MFEIPFLHQTFANSIPIYWTQLYHAIYLYVVESKSVEMKSKPV